MNKIRFSALITAVSLIVCQPSRGEQPLTNIPPEDSKIEYAGYVYKELVVPPDQPDAKVARFDRLLDMPGTGYRWDNPGARIRFRTDATTIAARLNYSELHQSKTARNGIGVWSVDGVFKPEWSFRSRDQAVRRGPETVEVILSNGIAGGFHDFEIVLPYGDSVDFAGLKVNPEARFEPTRARPAIRYVAYGDSITHGFSASAVNKSYPFLVGQAKGWETINLGFGGRSSFPAPTDAAVITSLKPDVVTVLLGVNDWNGGVSLAVYRKNMEAFLDNLRAAQPETPVYLLTPLWVGPGWNPPGKKTELENYRQVLRDIAAARGDPNLHLIEGTELIDPDLSLFDRVPLHPNDAGFVMMAGRLAQKLNSLKTQP